MNLVSAFQFAAFVLWLLAIPMDGQLLAAAGLGEGTRFFLLPHAASLALIGFFCPPRLFARLVHGGIAVTMLLTLALPLKMDAAPFLLVLIGIAGAFVGIGACLSLRRSTAPVVSAALGLVAANLLLIPFQVRPGGGLWQFSLVSLPLLILFWPAGPRPQEEAETGHAVGLWRYLPFVLVFQVVSGLMYGFVMPAYHLKALLPGAELPFYMLAVLGSIWIVKKSRDLTLVCGILLGMAAFALLQGGRTPLAINLSMFSMQAAAGFIDLFLLAFLLSSPRPVRAFGIGLAAVCLGIAAGKAIGVYLGNLAEAIAMTGHLTLNLAVLTLYFIGRYHYRPSPTAKPVNLPAGISEPLAKSPREGSRAEGPAGFSGAQDLDGRTPAGIRIPENLRLLLSGQEYQVLQLTLEGKTYRQAAVEMGISESTVKTYMGRIYTKLKVRDKRELLEALARL